MQLNLRKLRSVSKKEGKDIIARGLKLNEEAGELSAEILKYKGHKGSDKTKQEILKDLQEEAIDTLIMALDILVYTGAKEKQIAKVMDKKLDKWLKNLRKRNATPEYIRLK